jgi:hypothetical protein
MLNRLSPKNCGEQGCQIFLGTTYQNRKQIYQITTKHIKCPQNIPNVHKTYQMPVQYVDKMSMTYTNIFHCKTLKKLLKYGLLV